MRRPLIRASGVSFAWSPGHWALHNLSFELYRSERVCLLGANGAGKSTTLLLLNGAHSPCEGQIEIDGVPYEYSRQALNRIHRRVALILQNPDDQVLAQAVIDDVGLGSLAAGDSPAIARQKAQSALASVGMLEYSDALVDELSYGQKKRVAIAGALVSDPDLLIVDEPTAGLDFTAMEQMLAAFNEIAARGKCVLLTTHDTNLAWSWADRILILDRGALIESGAAPDEIAPEAWRTAGLQQPFVSAVWQRLPSVVTAGKRAPRTQHGLLDAVSQRTAFEEVG